MSKRRLTFLLFFSKILPETFLLHCGAEVILHLFGRRCPLQKEIQIFLVVGFQELRPTAEAFGGEVFSGCT